MADDIYDPKYVEGLFDRMSNSYERMNFITSFGFSIRWRRQFLDHFKQPERTVEILDLLTGMGETWAATKKKIPNSNSTVLDFSQRILHYAYKRNSEKFQNKMTVVSQDILNNRLPDNHYDFVTCAFGLKTFNPEQLVVLANETKRILKAGGHFSFIEFSKPRNLVLRKVYGFYLGRAIPVLGRLLLGNPAEYRMLWNYTDKFNNAELACSIFACTGLKTEFVSYFLGCSTGFHGRKLDELA